MNLDLTPLASAVQRLDEGWARHQADFQYLIRSGNEQGLLLGAWPQWPQRRQYRDMRGKTTHSDDEQVALNVVSGIPHFLAEAQYLVAALRSKQNPSPPNPRWR